MDKPNYLALDQQLCFPFYASSRMITRMYQPLLDEINLTYPQYLVMLVLWEHEQLTVGQIGKKLQLNTNTLTPIIKKMQQKALLIKTRSENDERVVNLALTTQGKALKDQAQHIPVKLFTKVSESMTEEELLTLRDLMNKFLRANS